MDNQPTVFIVEDEDKMREILKINLSKKYDVHFYRNAENAFPELKKKRPELIVTDVRLPGMNGIEFMEKVKNMDRSIPFIVFTGYGSIDHAVETMKKGAFDYLVKPIKIKNLVQSMERALSYVAVAKSKVELESQYTIQVEDTEFEFITHDSATIQMLHLVRKAAHFSSPVMITGETGTGKELVARYLHDKSGREGPLVKLNCASIPKDILEGELFGFKKGSFTGAVQDYEGKIALSDGGTLFLDEISELPVAIQSKLLHVLEIPEYYPIGSNIKKSVDLNLITATNKNLRIMVDDELFRHDLYYRIAVIPITIPPLRERKCDIIPLVEYFLKTEGGNFILSPEAKLKLLGYSWPGNVRELKNVIERSCLLTENGNLIDSIIFDADGYQSSEYSQDHTAYDVPATWQEFKTFKTKVVKDRKEELEKIFIEKLLIKHNGNISECSRSAGIDRRQFQDMIKALNIDVSLFR